MATKKTAKYELSRADIEKKLREISEKLEDTNVFETSPNDFDNLVNEVLSDVESLADEVLNKAY